MYRKMDRDARYTQLQELNRQLDILEHWIQGDGPFVLGTKISYADACLFPTLTFAVRTLPDGVCAWLHSAGCRRASCPRCLPGPSPQAAVLVHRGGACQHVLPALSAPSAAWRSSSCPKCSCGPFCRSCVGASGRPIARTSCCGVHSRRCPQEFILPEYFGWTNLYKTRPKLAAHMRAMLEDVSGARVRTRRAQHSMRSIASALPAQRAGRSGLPARQHTPYPPSVVCCARVGQFLCAIKSIKARQGIGGCIQPA